MTNQEHITALQTFIAAGDIAGMARMIEALRDQWNSLQELQQAEVLKLEAIFLSLVKLRAEGGR